MTEEQWAGEEQAVEQAKPVKKKGSMFSVTTGVVLGLLALAAFCPVGDIDGDGKMDVSGKWVMLKVMTSQENSKVGAPTPPGEVMTAIPAGATGSSGPPPAM